eukprot:TRINITY_DN9464_c0_g1_i1.p1 TRINITY_DN9464_c0_g1~~TRINITY_DN9464_c0_g1_i1.p1  ORF type:complete len:105 (-),score=5.31 TRINITY_DN9464_c0_g1_i1:621-935(-)
MTCNHSDIQEHIIYEYKGAVCALYWSNTSEVWSLYTPNSIDGSELIGYKKFSYLFWKIFKKLNYLYPEDKHLIYFFQLEAPQLSLFLDIRIGFFTHSFNRQTTV